MPLFGSARDASLLRSVSRELIGKIISTEVEVYQLSLENTTINIYNEARQKTYFSPIRVGCIIRKEDKITSGDDYGLDYTRNVSFAFLRDDLKDINLVLSEGDIIQWDNKFFEIDNVKDSAYWMTRNPDTYTPWNLSEVPEHGYSVSIIAETHETAIQLNIVDERSGINSNAVVNNLPKNL